MSCPATKARELAHFLVQYEVDQLRGPGAGTSTGVSEVQFRAAVDACVKQLDDIILLALTVSKTELANALAEITPASLEAYMRSQV